jgi:hypothetical protein
MSTRKKIIITCKTWLRHQISRLQQQCTLNPFTLSAMIMLYRHSTMLTFTRKSRCGNLYKQSSSSLEESGVFYKLPWCSLIGIIGAIIPTYISSGLVNCAHIPHSIIACNTLGQYTSSFSSLPKHSKQFIGKPDLQTFCCLSSAYRCMTIYVWNSKRSISSAVVFRFIPIWSFPYWVVYIMSQSPLRHLFGHYAFWDILACSILTKNILCNHM